MYRLDFIKNSSTEVCARDRQYGPFLCISMYFISISIVSIILECIILCCITFDTIHVLYHLFFSCICIVSKSSAIFWPYQWEVLKRFQMDTVSSRRAFYYQNMDGKYQVITWINIWKSRSEKYVSKCFSSTCSWIETLFMAVLYQYHCWNRYSICTVSVLYRICQSLICAAFMGTYCEWWGHAPKLPSMGKPTFGPQPSLSEDWTLRNTQCAGHATPYGAPNLSQNYVGLGGNPAVQPGQHNCKSVF